MENDVRGLIGVLRLSAKFCRSRGSETLKQVGINCDLAADALSASLAREEVLKEALGQIAGKNDLSGVPYDDLEAAARGALYECELIARAALQEQANEQ